MSKQRSDAAIDTGLVMTVLGPVPVDEMGVTLMHEHLLVDARSWWHEPKQAERLYLAEGPCSTIDPWRAAHGPVCQSRQLPTR